MVIKCIIFLYWKKPGSSVVINPVHEPNLLREAMQLYSCLASYMANPYLILHIIPKYLAKYRKTIRNIPQKHGLLSSSNESQKDSKREAVCTSLICNRNLSKIKMIWEDASRLQETKNISAHKMVTR